MWKFYSSFKTIKLECDIRHFRVNLGPRGTASHPQICPLSPGLPLISTNDGAAARYRLSTVWWMRSLRWGWLPYWSVGPSLDVCGHQQCLTVTSVLWSVSPSSPHPLLHIDFLLCWAYCHSAPVCSFSRALPSHDLKCQPGVKWRAGVGFGKCFYFLAHAVQSPRLVWPEARPDLSISPRNLCCFLFHQYQMQQSLFDGCKEKNV